MNPTIKSRLTSKKVLIPTAIATVLGTAGVVLGANYNNAQIEACNSGTDNKACEYVLTLNPKDHYISKLDPQVLAKRDARLAAEAEAKQKADAEAEAERVAARQAADAALAEKEKQRERIAANARAAEAKFKAEGWTEQEDGIYTRWCTQTCTKTGVIGDNTYALMEVYAKGRAAGDIYAQVNLLQDGVVVGYTNDTLFLSQGQKGILTFDTYKSANSMELTKFNVRGSW